MAWPGLGWAGLPGPGLGCSCQGRSGIAWPGRFWHPVKEQFWIVTGSTKRHLFSPSTAKAFLDVANGLFLYPIFLASIHSSLDVRRI